MGFSRLKAGLWQLFPVGMAVLFALRSPFAPGARADLSGDSSLFAYVGWAMTQGQMVYTDVWDNKGPLLYLLNFWGVSINAEWGIFVIELVTLLVAALFLAAICRRFLEPRAAALASCLCLLPLHSTLESGNLSEEYALPFLWAVLFVFVRSFATGPDAIEPPARLLWWHALVVGSCCGAIAALRLNILALPLVLCVTAMVVIGKREGVLRVVSLTCCAAVGLLAVVVPIGAWLRSKSALMECLDAAYLNALPVSPTIGERLAATSNMISRFQPDAVLLLAVAVSCWWAVRGYRKGRGRLGPLPWATIIGIVLTLAVNSLNGRSYLHYLVALVPALTVPIVVFVALGVKALGRLQLTRAVPTLAVGLLSLALTLPTVLAFPVSIAGRYVPATAAVPNYREPRQVADVAFVAENAAPGDTIAALGYDWSVYFRSRRLAASRMIYLPMDWWNDDFRLEYLREMTAELADNRPAVILFDSSQRLDYLRESLPADESKAFTKFVESYEEASVEFSGIAYVRKSS